MPADPLLPSTVRLVLPLLVATAALAAVPRAQEPPRSADESGIEGLPLREVTLFMAGVGFFEHRATVAGDVEIPMRFSQPDLNDLLKSMVVQDASGESSIVRYESQDPLAKALAGFPFDLSGNPTMGELLLQLRGQRVEIETPGRMTGTIVGVEARHEPVSEGDTMRVDVLNLLTVEGFRSVPLPSIRSLRLLDERLQADFERALALLASRHDSEHKSVVLALHGEGEREVRVGYVQQTPVWKASYRLVLGEDGESLMQGWAIVENQTEKDWRDVRLTLVSGRPVTYVMNLYDPRYVTRPVVEPELYESLRPQEHEEALRRLGELAKAGADVRAPRESRSRGGRLGALPPAAAPQGEALDEFAVSPQAMAAGEEVGELFRYVIDTPVTLERRQSAMLPILDARLGTEKVSVFDAAVHPKHPLDAVRIRNTTDLDLMPGALTVYDGGTFAGDALLTAIAPGEERLVSYALDLDLEVATEGRAEPQRLRAGRIAGGTLVVEHRQVRARTYTVRNTSDAERRLLIEVPRQAGWEIVEPEKPFETTRDAWRVQVAVGPHAGAEQDVVEQIVLREEIALLDLPVDRIAAFADATVLSEEVRTALRTALAMRRELDDLAHRRQRALEEIEQITAEQTRIRENMRALDRTAELYGRYLAKLEHQEDRIDELRRQITELETRSTAKRAELVDWLNALDLR